MSGMVLPRKGEYATNFYQNHKDPSTDKQKEISKQVQTAPKSDKPAPF